MVQAELGAPIEFVVSEIRVSGEWAFVIARPQRPGGTAINFTYTRYAAAYRADMMSDLAIALLRSSPAGWLVHAYVFGPTDVAWLDWIGAYPAPRDVFPF